MYNVWNYTVQLPFYYSFIRDKFYLASAKQLNLHLIIPICK